MFFSLCLMKRTQILFIYLLMVWDTINVNSAFGLRIFIDALFFQSLNLYRHIMIFSCISIIEIENWIFFIWIQSILKCNVDKMETHSIEDYYSRLWSHDSALKTRQKCLHCLAIECVGAIFKTVDIFFCCINIAALRINNNYFTWCLML